MVLQNKLRGELAQQFLDALNQGQLPWKACWQQVRPCNAATGKAYRGVNALNLSYWANKLGYTDPRWCTYKQARDNGWQVRQGEKACRVEYWAYYDTKQKKLLSWQEAKDCLKADPSYSLNLRLSCRTYFVFNGAQIDGIPALAQRHTDIGAIREQRDTLILNMGIGYRETGAEAYYSSYDDTVTLPPEVTFDDVYSYMATFLHECGHASGHPGRLNRDMSGGFGSPNYAKEELRAEIASAFTAQALGFRLTEEQLQAQMQRHIAYVQNWVQVLEKNPEELFRAIKAAEEISDYLMEKGEFQKAMEEQSVYYHFYHQGGYLFTVSGEAQAQAVYDRLCADARAMGYSWSDSGKAYRSDVPEAPASDLASSDRTVTANRPFSETLYQEHMAHLKFLCEDADRSRYWEAGRQTLRTSPRAVMEQASRYPWASREQLDEIAAGIQSGLSAESVAVYARQEFTPIQMNSLRYAASDGLSMEKLQLLANPALESVQMDILRACLQSGMDMEQVRSLAVPEIPAQKMLDTCWDFLQGQAAEAPQPIPDYGPEM